MVHLPFKQSLFYSLGWYYHIIIVEAAFIKKMGNKTPKWVYLCHSYSQWQIKTTNNVKIPSVQYFIWKCWHKYICYTIHILLIYWISQQCGGKDVCKNKASILPSMVLAGIGNDRDMQVLLRFRSDFTNVYLYHFHDMVICWAWYGNKMEKKQIYFTWNILISRLTPALFPFHQWNCVNS